MWLTILAEVPLALRPPQQTSRDGRDEGKRGRERRKAFAAS